MLFLMPTTICQDLVLEQPCIQEMSDKHGSTAIALAQVNSNLQIANN